MTYSRNCIIIRIPHFSATVKGGIVLEQREEQEEDGPAVSENGIYLTLLNITQRFNQLVHFCSVCLSECRRVNVWSSEVNEKKFVFLKHLPSLNWHPNTNIRWQQRGWESLGESITNWTANGRQIPRLNRRYDDSTGDCSAEYHDFLTPSDHCQHAYAHMPRAPATSVHGSRVASAETRFALRREDGSRTGQKRG